MKTEEIYTKDKIVEFLKKEVYIQSVQEGSDPPDYDITVDNTVYALEITNAETLSSGNMKRREFSDPLFYLADEANKLDNLKVMLKDNTILIYINRRIQDYNIFRKTLLNKMITDVNLYTKSLEAFPEIGKLLLIPRFIDKKPIQIIIGDLDSEIDIQKHIDIIVEKILKEKKAKMDSAKIQNERWLGIKINHFFTREECWVSAISKLGENHGFSRVFFVIPEFKVFDYRF